MEKSSFELIDTHSHIYLDQFDEDREEVISRAKEAGVKSILLPNIDIDSVNSLMALCDHHPNYCYAMMGLHPCSVEENYEEQLDNIWGISKQLKIYAVGEIGLDLYWRKDNLDAQLNALRLQFDWAIKKNLPVAMHCREANSYLIAELKEYAPRGLKGVWHCFTGSEEEAKKVCDLGFYLGIGGVLTYKKSELKNFVERLETDKILFETDAPYLSPVPKRGKRNEPSYTLYTAKFFAECTGKSLEYWAEKSTNNAIRLFNLPQI